jgi:hypothetical protein
MARFNYQNHSDYDIDLIIEPWAMVESISPGEVVEFEVNDSAAPDIEFATTETGQLYIFVMSEKVSIRIKEKDYVFETEKRPPAKLFQVMRKYWTVS